MTRPDTDIVRAVQAGTQISEQHRIDDKRLEQQVKIDGLDGERSDQMRVILRQSFATVGQAGQMIVALTPQNVQQAMKSSTALVQFSSALGGLYNTARKISELLERRAQFDGHSTAKKTSKLSTVAGSPTADGPV